VCVGHSVCRSQCVQVTVCANHGKCVPEAKRMKSGGGSGGKLKKSSKGE
jgi:hypothetical protein